MTFRAERGFLKGNWPGIIFDGLLLEIWALRVGVSVVKWGGVRLDVAAFDCGPQSASRRVARSKSKRERQLEEEAPVASATSSDSWVPRLYCNSEAAAEIKRTTGKTSAKTVSTFWLQVEMDYQCIGLMIHTWDQSRNYVQKFNVLKHKKFKKWWY